MGAPPSEAAAAGRKRVIGPVRPSPRPQVSVQRALGVEAAAWDALVVRQPTVSPFLRSWWLDGAAGHRPLLLLVHEDHKLLGGLALEEDRRLVVPRLLALGSALAPDHVDLVAAPGREQDVLDALGRWLRRPGSRLLDLTCVVDSHRLAGLLPHVASDEVVEAAPYTELGDFDELLRSRPSQLRNTVDRARRRLEKHGVRYRCGVAEEVEDSLKALRRLHGEAFGMRSLFLPYFDRFAAVARAGVRSGEVVFNELCLDDDVIATVVTFEVGSCVSYYQVGRATDHCFRGSGTYLEARMLERVCREGFRQFDHLRGQEAYKRAWAPQLRPLRRVRAVQGRGGRTALAAFAFASRLHVRRAPRRRSLGLSP